jgi:hypothetical protein
MATPGMLVQVMAETLGIPAPTVILYDRVLAENGLRSKSGRGNSAARVTEKDAANLLIALMAAPVQGATVRDAALTCQTYGQLRLFGRASAGKEFAKYGLLSLKKLAGEAHFSQAVEALIREAADGGEFRYRGRVKSSRDNDRPFNIKVQGPTPWACFQVNRPADEPPGPELYFSEIARKPRSPSDPDMWQARHVTYRTIRALGSLIVGESEEAKAKKGGA